MTREDAHCLRQPIDGKIFFAGEHTTFPENQHGTLLGAYLSGLRVSQHILSSSSSSLEKSQNGGSLNFTLPHEKFPEMLAHL